MAEIAVMTVTPQGTTTTIMAALQDITTTNREIVSDEEMISDLIHLLLDKAQSLQGTIRGEDHFMVETIRQVSKVVMKAIIICMDMKGEDTTWTEVDMDNMTAEQIDQIDIERIDHLDMIHKSVVDTEMTVENGMEEVDDTDNKWM